VLEGDDDAGMVEEVERGAVAAVDEHEVDAGAAEAQQRRKFVEGTRGDILQRDRPGENTEGEPQLPLRDPDDQLAVVRA